MTTGRTETVSIIIERALVVRVDRYDLPHLAFVLESELRPGEEADVREVEVECVCWGYYIPAKLSGPPEDCYPEEGDFEVQSTVAIDYPDVQFGLTEAEEDELEQQHAETDDYDGPDYEPEWDDYPEYYDGTGTGAY